MKKKRVRADEKVAQLEEIESRAKAQAVIMAGDAMFRISEDDTWKKIDKAGQQIPDSSQIQVKNRLHQDVGRGAQKLRSALDAFAEIKLDHKKVLDIGSSTGGFTQVCLQKRATQVVAIDVGTNQLHEKLRADARVVSIEKQHILLMSQERWFELNIEPIFEFICTDVSFISLTRIIPFAVDWLAPNGDWVMLIKPQFELEAKKVPKGVVKSEEYRKEAIAKIATSIQQQKCLKWMGLVESAVKGAEGNQEYLLWVKKVD